MQRLPLFLALVLAIPATARQPVHAKNGMVVAMESIAADAGVQVLKSGGNAIDAAVAVGFALSVTHPYAGNIGGGGCPMRLTNNNGSIEILKNGKG